MLRTVRPRGEIDAIVLDKTLLEPDGCPGRYRSRRWKVMPHLAKGSECCKGKVRIIDNLTSSYVNETVQAYESPPHLIFPHGVLPCAPVSSQCSSLESAGVGPKINESVAPKFGPPNGPNFGVVVSASQLSSKL